MSVLFLFIVTNLTVLHISETYNCGRQHIFVSLLPTSSRLRSISCSQLGKFDDVIKGVLTSFSR